MLEFPKSAGTVEKSLVDGFITKFRCPEKVHTYEGKNIRGVLMQKLCEWVR